MVTRGPGATPPKTWTRPSASTTVRVPTRTKDLSMWDKGNINLSAVRGVADTLRAYLRTRPRTISRGAVAGQDYPRASTKLSSTILRPALSNATVSLLPSTASTVPGPNFECRTRPPDLNAEADPGGFATGSPWIVIARRRSGERRAAGRSSSPPAFRAWAGCQPGVW